jgi:hypothetical protein
VTIKTALSWKDCYKNAFLTFMDYSNWIGPKALWLDFCDFTSSQDFIIYYYNPFNLATDTGDQSFLTAIYNGVATTTAGGTGDYYDGTIGGGTVGSTTVAESRPSSSQANFYRDCFAIDDTQLALSTNWGPLSLSRVVIALF